MRQHFSNTAQPTTLTGDVSNSATTLPVVATAGFPAVPFKISIEHGTPDEEICLITAVTTTSMTAIRGYDNTAAVAHNTNDPVEHVVSAGDYEAMNAHIEDTSLDQHTQYLTAGRHAAIDHSAMFSDPVSVVATTGAARTLSFLAATVWDLTLNVNTVLTISDPPASGTAKVITLIIREGATPRTVSFANAVVWPDGGSFPALAANSINIVQLFTADGGTTYYGSVWSNVLTDTSGFLTVATAGSTYMPLAGGAFAGVVSHGTSSAPQDIQFATLDRISGKVASVGTSGAIALKRGQTHEQSGNSTGALTFSYAAAGSGGPVSGVDCTSAIIIKMGGTAYTATWMSGIKWAGGVAPTFLANKWYLVTLVTTDGGTNSIGAYIEAS